MTEQDQRIAIAEACYGKPQKQQQSLTDAHKLFWIIDGGWKLIPDYLQDLNAMHKAEKTLNEKQSNAYTYQLTQVLRVKVLVDILDILDVFELINASASQRAEAFLKTKGLWKDSTTETRKD